jgi:hypothetical protein
MLQVLIQQWMKNIKSNFNFSEVQMSGGDFGVLIAAFEFRTFFFGGTKV